MSVRSPLRLAALCWVGLSLSSAAPPVIPTEVMDAVAERVDFGYTPGMIVGMVNADGRTWSSYGGRTWDDRTLPDADTVYEIASVTKTFTGVLLAQMVEAGEVALDDLVSTYLPEGTAMPSGGGETITLEDLATHYSGLPGAVPQPGCIYIEPANALSGYTPGDIYEFLAGFALPRAPGVAFEYSNFGIALLGHALALSQGTSYENLLKARVIDPLGLADTAITLAPEQEARRLPGHGGYVERPRFVMDELAPAGGLASTMDDLLTFVENNMGLVANGVLNDAMAASHVARASMPAINGVSMEVGLTWWRWDLGGGVVQHGGDSLGSAAFIGFHPAGGVGAVVLSNARRHEFSDVRDLGMRCLGVTPGVLPTTAPATVPLAEKLNYVGRYRVSSFELAIGIVRDELTLFANGIEVTMYPRGGRRFSVFDAAGGADMIFSVDAGGETTGMTLEQVIQGVPQSLPFTRIIGDPILSIARDCDDVVVNLLAEPEQLYTLEASGDGETWTAIGPWSIKHPPHREAIGGSARVFRLAE